MQTLIFLQNKNVFLKKSIFKFMQIVYENRNVETGIYGN